MQLVSTFADVYFKDIKDAKLASGVPAVIGRFGP